MINLKKWFHETGREKALKVLDTLAVQFKDGRGKPDWSKAVQVFSAFSEDRLEPSLKKTIDAVFEGLSLKDEVNALKTTWKKVPRELRKFLTTSLQAQPEAVTWNVLGENGEGISGGDLEGPMGNLINFTNRANMGLVLHSYNSGAAEKAIGLTCQGDERFLKIGLQGKLEASPRGSMQMGFVGIKGSSDARGTARLDYYYLNKADWLFVEAMVHNLPHLASPFAAVDIAAGKEHRLRAVRLSVNGSLGASISLTCGKTWGASLSVKNEFLDLDADIQIGAAVNLGFQAALNFMGQWDVLVKPKDNHTLEVRLQKERSKEKCTTFSLDAAVGISGLDTVGEGLIKNYLPDPSGLLAQLNQFSNFGSLLKGEVKEKLNHLLQVNVDNTLKNELVEVLVGEGKAGDLAEVMGRAAETAFNEKLDLLQGQLSNVSGNINTGMVEKLKLPGPLGKKLAAATQGKMTELLKGIENKLKGKLAALINQQKGKLESLFKPLEAVGEKAAGLTAEVDKLSQQLLGPTIKLLTRYQQVRNKVTKAVQYSSRLKLGLHFCRQLKSCHAAKSVLEFEVDTRETEAREYYKEMMAGNFGGALAAARKSEKGSQGIKLVGGSFKASVMNRLTTDVTVNLLGAQLTSKTILSSDVQVEVDVSGNIMMANNRAELEKFYKAFGESRLIRFINLMEIPGSVPQASGAGTDGRTGITKIFSSGLSMSYKDQRLKKSELDAYLGSLKRANLISPASLKAAENRYNELLDQAKSQGKKMGGEIGLSMSLTSTDIQTLIDTTDLQIENTAIEHQLFTYFGEPGTSPKRRAFSAVLAKWTAVSGDEIAKIKKIGGFTPGEVLIRYNTKPGTFRNQEDVSPTDRHYLNAAHTIGRNAASLVKIVHNLRQAAKTRFTENSLKQDVEKLNVLNKETNTALNNWLKIRKILSSLGIARETIPAVTLAFIATIGELCQLKECEEEFLTPTVKWSVLDWKEEVFG